VCIYKVLALVQICSNFRRTGMRSALYLGSLDLCTWILNITNQFIIDKFLSLLNWWSPKCSIVFRKSGLVLTRLFTICVVWRMWDHSDSYFILMSYSMKFKLGQLLIISFFFHTMVLITVSDWNCSSHSCPNIKSILLMIILILKCFYVLDHHWTLWLWTF